MHHLHICYINWCAFKVKNNQYYLEGALALLDYPGEWVYQQDTKMLHVCLHCHHFCHHLFAAFSISFTTLGKEFTSRTWSFPWSLHSFSSQPSSFPLHQVIPPSDTTGRCEELNLRGRTVDYGLVITDSENVTLANLTFFSSNVMAHGDRQIELDSIDFKFPSSSHRMLSSASLPLATRLDVGLQGIVHNCTFLGAEGPALEIDGACHACPPQEVVYRHHNLLFCFCCSEISIIFPVSQIT